MKQKGVAFTVAIGSNKESKTGKLEEGRCECDGNAKSSDSYCPFFGFHLIQFGLLDL